MSLEQSTLRRYQKVPIHYTTSCPANAILKPFDSKNFIMINPNLLKRVSDVKRRQFKKIKKKKLLIPNEFSQKELKDNEEDEEQSKLISGSDDNETSQRKKNVPAHTIINPSKVDMGLKSVVVTRNASASNYSLRVVRKKITASNEDSTADTRKSKGSKKMLNDLSFGSNTSATTSAAIVINQPSMTNSKEKPNFMKMTSNNRKIHYGWFLNTSDEFRVVRKGESNYVIKHPDEWTCLNERKAWAGQYIMCVGQTTLCKWL